MSDSRTLPGFREFYPEEYAIQGHIKNIWRKTCRRFSFREWESPILEPLELFTEKSGEEIVRQLFNFEDKGGRKVTLRPEMTPSLARMVGSKANSMPKPIRWFAIGENFRYEKPQKGRLRAFYQLNADLLGEASPAADAEVIALCADCLLNFGLRQCDFHIRISDRTLWFHYLATLGIREAQAIAVLSVIDKLERGSPQTLLDDMTVALEGTKIDPDKTLLAARTFANTKSLADLYLIAANDTSMIERLADWKQLIDSLSDMGYSECISIDLTIVRGLAYYTGFVFETFESGGEARALAGGGRYDTLVKRMGGPDLPAVGFGMGDVTLLDLLRLKKLIPAYSEGPDYYCIILGECVRSTALKDIFKLRQSGIQVEYNLKAGKFPKLIQAAEVAGSRYALIYGPSEIAQGKVKVRRLADRIEFEVLQTDLIPALRAILEDGIRVIQP